MANKKEPAVALAEKTNVTVAIPEDYLNEIMGDAGAGTSNLGMDDVAVPYLYILQSNSPQCDPDHVLYIPEAKSGMFYNNVTNEIFEGREKGLDVIPCAYERKFVEWVDRDKGGGWVRDYDTDSDIMSKCKPNDKGRPVLPDGHLIVETAYHYVYMHNPHTGHYEEIIIPMKSSALKHSRRWNKTLMSTYIPGTEQKAPRWLYPYNLKTAKEEKNGKTWSGPRLERLGTPVTPTQYRAAKAFAQQFESGEIIRAKETAAIIDDDAAGASLREEANERARDRMDKDEIPF